jgi:Putative peptidoglycan binding domain
MRNRSRRTILFTFISSCTSIVSGCTLFANDAERGLATKSNWDGQLIYTTADVRIVTQRRHPVTHQWVLCTEPSPDVAKALSTAIQVSAQGGNGAANGSLGFAGGSAEAATELAGRTTALLALRDGLYHTCEAYANGALGADAYALVLARYGQLMTTLFLAQDIASATSGANSAGGTGVSIMSPAVTLAAPTPSPGSQSGGSQSAGSGAPPTVTGGTTTGGTTHGGTTSGGVTTGGTTTGGTTTGATTTGATTTGGTTQNGVTTGGTTTGGTTTGGTTTGGTTTGGTTTGGTTTGGTTTGGTTSGGTPSGGPGPGGTPSSAPPGQAIVAASLVRMSEDYDDLDRDPTQLLLVSCINDNDPTRLKGRREEGSDAGSGEGEDQSVNAQRFVGGNPWLAPVCGLLARPGAIRQMEWDSAVVAAESGHPGKPIDITAGITPPAQTVQPAGSNSGAPKNASIASQPTASLISFVQEVLISTGNASFSKPTGTLGPQTVKALKALQTKYKLSPSGNIDGATLAALYAELAAKKPSPAVPQPANPQEPAAPPPVPESPAAPKPH